MAVNTAELKDKLAERAIATTANKPMKPEDTIRAYLQRMGPEISRALPKHMDADRLARVALTTIRSTPKLLECNVQSLLAAVMQAAQLGLEPGLLGHCYIIPYGKEAQFQIGYKGMIDLARRSGSIESIAAHAVYDNDEFEFEYGLNEKLRHVPNFDGDRGQIRLFYGYAKFVGGGHQILVMSKAEVDAIRRRSKSGNNGPWVTDYEEMGKKTVIRRMFKYLPISIEIMQQVEANDNTVKRDIAESMADVPDDSTIIDITPEEVAATHDQGDDAPVGDGLPLE